MAFSKDVSQGSSTNKAPTWNGSPEGFFHYVTEIKCYLAGTKASERPYAAARLVRKLLESEHPSLKSLAYKLDPSEFTSEDAIAKLIAFLEASPMNRQAVPEAGRQLSAYYRRLSRRPQETIPQFLVREETLYDGMWRALQRLLREKELDFDQFDCSLEELKRFCGMGEESFYVPGTGAHDTFLGSQGSESGSTHPSRFAHQPEQDDLDEDAEDAEDRAPQSSHTSSHASARAPVGAPPSKPAKRLDLIERLMQKGLIPLAALDIIWGWLLLECASATELDKSLVKAATQNKLGYQNIRSALLSLHEDRVGKGHSAPPNGFDRGGKGQMLNMIAENDYDDAQFQDPWHEDYDPEVYGEENFNGDEHENPEGESPENPVEDDPQGSMSEDQAMQMIAHLQEEEKELNLMMADAQRNLEQARRAVQEAKKDRGWKSSKGSPPHGMQKGTSTFMQGKGLRLMQRSLWKRWTCSSTNWLPRLATTTESISRTTVPSRAWFSIILQ